jgi:beta-glucanase (GH16 family)
MEGGPGCSNCWQVVHSVTDANTHWGTSVQNNPGGGFHTYAMDWSGDSATFYVDGRVTMSLTRSGMAAGEVWPFSGPFVIVLASLTGDWAGQPTSGTTFPATMLVDYVRVYE